MPKAARLSPGRRQYLHFKQQYPDALLLFRMGDFYETFDEDARTMARVLDIALTARDVGGGVKAPLAGIPHHSLEGYLGRLVKEGLKIAVCEQTSDPAASKGIVDRAVVRIVTPGTVLEPGLLEQDRNNYLVAVVTSEASAGLAYVDVTTSDFVTSEINLSELRDEIDRLNPAEVLADAGAKDALTEAESYGLALRDLDQSRLDAELAEDALKRHFGASTLEAYGCSDKPLAVVAASAVIEFLRDTQLGVVPQITSFRTLSADSFMRLDRRALRDLEVFEPVGGRTGAPTLLSAVDRTRTPMGSRLLRSWLARPLMDLAALQARQDFIQWFADNAVARGEVREALRKIPDLERLTNRTRTFSASPRDVAALARGLSQVPVIEEVLTSGATETQPSPSINLKRCDEVIALAAAAIADDPPMMVGDGNAIRQGFNDELDELRSLSGEARSHIAAIESDARESTGIKSLKVGYNKVFGYFIEVSRTNLERVPPEFERRQTLVNGERFITPALKELEAKILNARDRISEVERALFRRVCGDISAHSENIMASARAIAELDALCGLAEAAAEGGWIRPALNDTDAIRIRDGRHPVVEAALGAGRFVPNDLDLSSAGQQILIITGPNMSGKSTYIRQAAVLTLLAQTGSFIPAGSAEIGLVDRIFTRAGLSDDIAGGQSTFMVEMVETAAILNQATSRSLAILDEIGRGTSTYDGLAIARAVAEYLHNDKRLGCKTLFATHYHEMTALADALPRAANFKVAVSEDGNEVAFLHRIVPGGADRSYGVHVARLAGMPRPVVSRAWQLLDELEKGKPAEQRESGAGVQIPLFGGTPPVVEDLLALDVADMTPLDAINALYRLQEKAREGDDVSPGP
ncbi:MAG: DNA mismatch repair protein MutS [Dehalococcoidia bacterium]